MKWTVVAAFLSAAACATAHPVASAQADPSCTAGDGTAALADCLTPTQTPAYYVAQGNQYFDALDRSAPDTSVPTYSVNVARWEWPPWLKLTGYTRAQMQGTDKLVKVNAPAVVSPRDCRFFSVEPFCRCRVSFNYDNMGDGKGCAIYEEFTFNDAGEITFVEAWSDLPGDLPFADPGDLWGEGSGVHRLSAKIPGLGAADGLIDPAGAAMTAAASQDAEIADFAARANDFWAAWADENNQNPDYFKVGCGW